MNDNEKKAVVATALMAAFADGAKVEREREEIRKIAEGLAGADQHLSLHYQDVLLGRLTTAQVAQQLQSSEARQLAYEMAVCVCDADGTQSASEKQFLAELARTLGLDVAAASAVSDSAESIAAQPLEAPAPREDGELDGMILNNAILCAALEQIPQRLATMAIVPLQMRMVYKVGARYGFTLDKGHVLDLLAAAGLGATSQLIDNFARQLVERFAGRFAGGLVRGLAGRATSSAIAFGTTYALGHLAKRYYSGGRKLSGAQIRETFRGLVDEARGVESSHLGSIAARARALDVTQLASLVRSG
ncbi:MAG: DUF533 domain-containing protein [Planctomycetes bacterium]|nr:DUF533 domain-containing protein [Planctomycetota bacterium]